MHEVRAQGIDGRYFDSDAKHEFKLPERTVQQKTVEGGLHLVGLLPLYKLINHMLIMWPLMKIAGQVSPPGTNNLGYKQTLTLGQLKNSTDHHLSFINLVESGVNTQACQAIEAKLTTIAGELDLVATKDSAQSLKEFADTVLAALPGNWQVAFISKTLKAASIKSLPDISKVNEILQSLLKQLSEKPDNPDTPAIQQLWRIFRLFSAISIGLACVDNGEIAKQFIQDFQSIQKFDVTGLLARVKDPVEFRNELRAKYLDTIMNGTHYVFNGTELESVIPHAQLTADQRESLSINSLNHSLIQQLAEVEALLRIIFSKQENTLDQTPPEDVPAKPLPPPVDWDSFPHAPSGDENTEDLTRLRSRLSAAPGSAVASLYGFPLDPLPPVTLEANPDPESLRTSTDPITEDMQPPVRENTNSTASGLTEVREGLPMSIAATALPSQDLDNNRGIKRPARASSNHPTRRVPNLKAARRAIRQLGRFCGKLPREIEDSPVEPNTKRPKISPDLSPDSTNPSDLSPDSTSASDSNSH